MSNFRPAISGKRLIHQSLVKVHKDGWRLEHTVNEERLRAGLVHRAEEKAQGDPVALHCSLMRVCGVDRARLSWRLHSDSMRSKE